MNTIASIVSPVLTVAAVAWLYFMMRAMFGIIGLAPSGEKWRIYNRLGMWNFGAIRADLGPAAEPHLRTMKLGAYVFIAFFVIALAFGLLSAVFTGNPDAN